MRDGRMLARAYATDVRDMRAHLVFDGYRVRVERATARVKRGDVDTFGETFRVRQDPAYTLAGWFLEPRDGL